jgi:hypothetical protein
MKVTLARDINKRGSNKGDAIKRDARHVVSTGTNDSPKKSERSAKKF